MTTTLTANMLLSGYARGIFPMAESRDADSLHWFRPENRGIIPMNGFHISRSLAKTIRSEVFQIRTNTAFSAVIAGCAARDETWINAPLVKLYETLHAAGYAHSLEVWKNDELAGGIFAITIGGAFFGESMFSNARDASKVALAYTVDRLRQTGFALFDTQYLTPHLASLGGVEIPAVKYEMLLDKAVARKANFADAPIPTAQALLHRITQTS